MGTPTDGNYIYPYPYRKNRPAFQGKITTEAEQKIQAAAIEKFQSMGKDPFKEAALKFHGKGYGSTGTSSNTTYVDPLPAPAADTQPKRAPVGHGHVKK